MTGLRRSGPCHQRPPGRDRSATQDPCRSRRTVGCLHGERIAMTGQAMLPAPSLTAGHRARALPGGHCYTRGDRSGSGTVRPASRAWQTSGSIGSQRRHHTPPAAVDSSWCMRASWRSSTASFLLHTATRGSIRQRSGIEFSGLVRGFKLKTAARCRGEG